jgi:monoterpene epsilon-lactone hydrolase
MNISDPDATVDELRAKLAIEPDTMPAPPGIAFRWETVGGVRALVALPDDGATDAALLYLHGGGYAIGSPDSHRGLTARLATLIGCPVVSVDYRLAPEHPHPAAIDDTIAAYQGLIDSGLDASRLAIAGDSAGGGLTLATLVKLRDDGIALPACAVGISPWTDLSLSGESMTRLADVDPMCQPAGLARMAAWFLGDTGDPNDPYASPLFADLHGLPPLLVHVGEVETLLDDSRRFAERAGAAGVDCSLEVFPEMVHVFHVFCGVVPEADAACETVAGFVRKHIGL